jgi:putative ABC transport system permease protein
MAVSRKQHVAVVSLFVRLSAWLDRCLARERAGRVVTRSVSTIGTAPPTPLTLRCLSTYYLFMTAINDRPDWAAHVRPRLRGLRLSATRENEIVEELSQHLDDRWRELVAGGASEDEATRLALADFREGNLLAQYLAPLTQARAPAPLTPGAPAGRALADLWYDLRHAARTLRKQPAFTIAAVLTLALGIGANSGIFAVVNAVLLRPLPYPDHSRLFVLYERRPAPVNRTRFSAENFLDLPRRSFAAIGGYIGTGFTLSGDGEPEFVVGQMISAELLDVLGVQPGLGRAFHPDENEGGRDQVMLLSHGLWQRRYGGDPGVVGRTVIANRKPYTVIGVMPAGFDFPDKRYELWVPFAFRANAQGMVTRSARFLQVLGRLRDGASPEQARAELDTIAARLVDTYPADNANMTMGMASLADETVGDVRTALLLMLSAVGFVLLIACANVTSLLLARSTARAREMAVRTTLGASRARLVRQLVTETMLLYTTGAGVGLLLAASGTRAVIALGPGDTPRLDQARLDPATVGFTLGLTLVAGLLFGVLPALHSTRRGPADPLEATARSTTAGRATRRARAALVAAEVALALMLTVGAALAARTLVQLHRVDTGLDAGGVLTFNLVPPEASYLEADRVRAFHREVLERLSQLPGAVATGATSHLPLSGQDIENRLTPEGWSPPSPDAHAVAGLRGVTGRYFDALGARVTAGRAFAAADGATAQAVAMVNEELARRYWPGQDPVGKRLKLGGLHSDDPWRLVVGVYADIKHRGPQAQTRPEVMLPYDQLDDEWVTRWMRGLSIVIRTPADPTSLVSAARGAVTSVDPAVPLVEPQRLTALVAESMAQPRFRSTLLVSFAVLAVLLAVVGIYGVVGFNVAQRTREISVRMALGAQRASVVRLILRQESRPVVIGIVVGLAGALAVGRTMRGMLFNVAPTDPVTFIAMPALLAAVAFAACIVPARRALAVEPSAALRAE